MLMVSVSVIGTPKPSAPPRVVDEYWAIGSDDGSTLLSYISIAREIPSAVQYGSMKVSAMVRLTLLVLIDADTELPLPKTLFCEIEPERMTPSALEYPTPARRLPVDFSVTVTSRSTWSGLPGTAGVS